MGNYKELIRKFDKVRDFTRDFYIYGFRSRNDFNHKSSRTYDNEKRRIESYMGKHLKWGYTSTGKKQFITMNCSQISTNPLYSAWKSKAFTDNDIVLHFYILSALKDNKLSIDELTNYISENSGILFDTQTVRNKCKEYIDEGLIISEKQNKALYYSNSNIYFENLLENSPNLLEAIKFYQGDTLLGEIGSFLADSNNIVNDRFLFKHYYIVHTLEDGVLLDILFAIRNNLVIEFENLNESKTKSLKFKCVPIKIFISSYTGRRYVCVYNLTRNRFFNYRLDHVKTVKTLEPYGDIESLKNKLENNMDKVWGVSFGGVSRIELISIKLFIDENTEQYVIERILREGKNGTLTKLEENTYIFTTELFDSNDISPWIKTFIGRIIQVEGTNDAVIRRFYGDINRMRRMYDE